MHVLFDVSVIAKGVDGILEIIGGALLFFVSPQHLSSLVQALTQHELSEDPHDAIATHLLNGAQHLTAGEKSFAAAYLLWHGVVKVALIAGLLMKRRWAYPAAEIAFTIFLIYQFYRYAHTHSTGLLLLSVLDVLVIILTWFEYRRLTATNGFA